VSLLDTAKAARVLAQSGFEADQVIKALDTTLSASRGLGMSVEQIQELQIAIKATTADLTRYAAGVDYASAALEKISRVESAYAVSGQDLADALRITLPLLDSFGQGIVGMADNIDYAAAITTVLVERLRITGAQAANFQKIFLSRLTRPEVLKKLQETFDVKMFTPDGKEMLSIDRLLLQLTKRYQELQKSSPAKANALAVELSGGRNVPQMITLLESYDKIQKAANESALAFGLVNNRTAIATDTLLVSVERFRTSLAALSYQALQTSNVASGLKGILDLLSAGMLRGAQASAGGGTIGMLLTVLSGGAIVQGLRGTYTWLAGIAKTAGTATAATGALRTALMAIGSVGASMVRIFSPGGLLLAGLTAVVAGIGYAVRKIEEADGALARYRVKYGAIMQEDVFKTPAGQE